MARKTRKADAPSSEKTKTKKSARAKTAAEPLLLPSPDYQAKAEISEEKKLFVLDTNVLMHDPAAIMCFKEHNVFVSAILLEELDDHKKDRDRQIGFTSRESFRFLETLLDLAGSEADPEKGIPLSLLSSVAVAQKQTVAPTGLLFAQKIPVDFSAGPFTQKKPDNEFVSIALYLKENRKEKIILVSKDRTVRVKAKLLGLCAQDYKNDQVVEDIALLYSGTDKLPADFWKKVTNIHTWKHGEFVYWDITTPLAARWCLNQFLYLDDNAEGEKQEYVVLKTINDTAQIRTIRDYRKQKVYGINARNREQNFALNALLDPEIDFVSLAGKAGSGKTLSGIVAGLEQVLEKKLYNKIIFTREVISLGKEQGFLPGSEEAKLAPWLGALYDNLEVLTENDEKTKGDPATDEAMKKGKIGNPALEKAISIRSLNYMQGRTLIRKFFIIDETQNITATQAKQLITRAGPGTKVIFLGNLAQVATPYLSGTSSGLAYVVDRFKSYRRGAHITLVGVERSELAEFAANNL